MAKLGSFYTGILFMADELLHLAGDFPEILEFLPSVPSFTDLPPVPSSSSSVGNSETFVVPVMSKRARTDALTGGTGDVNPEYNVITFDIPAGTASDVVIQKTFTFPIQQFYGSRQTTTPIVELLKSSMAYSNVTLYEQVQAASSGFWVCLRMSLGGADNPGTGTLRLGPSQRTFYEYALEAGTAVSPSTILAAAYTVGAGTPQSTHNHNGDISGCVNHVDENGHGILLYGNTVTFTFVAHLGSTVTNTTRFVVYLYYRIKNVALDQYLAGQAALGGTLATN